VYEKGYSIAPDQGDIRIILGSTSSSVLKGEVRVLGASTTYSLLLFAAQYIAEGEKATRQNSESLPLRPQVEAGKILISDCSRAAAFSMARSGGY
jgi:hypothetical protein